MSDSSDSEVHTKKSKSSKKHSKPDAAVPVATEEFMIKPEKGVATVDTASWPLLLKVILSPLISVKSNKPKGKHPIWNERTYNTAK